MIQKLLCNRVAMMLLTLPMTLWAYDGKLKGKYTKGKNGQKRI